MRHVLLLAAALLLVPTTSAQADWGWGGDQAKETEDFDRTVDVNAAAPVRIETLNGSIEVETWDRNEVEIHAVKRARAADADRARELLAETRIVVDEGDGVTIRVERPERRGPGRRHGGVSVSFRLKLPRGAHLEADTTNGNIEVAGLKGPTTAGTTNGNVILRDVGDARVTTTNGSIEAEEVHGRFDGRTTNGSIRAEVLADHLAEDMELRTTNGSIHLALASHLAASIVAKAQNGRVTSDFDAYETERRRGYLALELGGGGPEIQLRTTNGRVRITEAR